jgi:hypothetical protein
MVHDTFQVTKKTNKKVLSRYFFPLRLPLKFLCSNFEKALKILSLK